MNWIDELNDRMEKSRLAKKEAGITEALIKRKQSSFEGGIANKGRKHANETKKIWSEKKKGHKRSEESVQKSIEGSKETKWLQLLEKYPLEIILNAQNNNGNHQFNTCQELGISHTSYVKLCKYYNIEKKKSKSDIADDIKQKYSDPVLVWKSSKNKPFHKIGKPKEYYSVSFCCKELNLHKGNMLANMRKGRAYNGYFFEKKNKA